MKSNSTGGTDTKFKTLDEPVFSDDLYYDLTDGYIKPEDMLENQEDIDKVNEAIETIKQFLDEAQKSGALELC